MNYDAYKNLVPYPNKANFTTKYYYKAGKVIAITSPYGVTQILVGKTIPDDAVMEKSIDGDAYAAARKTYNDEAARLQELFKQDFFKELGIELNSKRETLFAKAWEHGHSAGFSEVMNCGYDLVSLIED